MRSFTWNSRGDFTVESKMALVLGQDCCARRFWSTDAPEKHVRGQMLFCTPVTIDTW